MHERERARLTLALAALFAVNILLILVMSPMPAAKAETYRQGSAGDAVRQIQTKLKNWGYYGGVVDGIYGPKTEQAVREFQSRNGLVSDGVCGIRTQQAMGVFMSSAGAHALARGFELDLLARLISAEAGGQPYAAQVAVGAAALNRLRHPCFPDGLASVVYQPGAFGGVSGGGMDKPPGRTALRAARDAMNGADPSRGAVYFSPKTSEPLSRGVPGAYTSHTRARTTTAVIGGMSFSR
ncbi:MAG: peptidoglycan-binding protein [Oscillospiraceae bacterium]|nr:peptidoglycan-binding protein [Oscillospiraceae bacterium]